MIELIIVIVILAILAVIAAPKFLNLSQDAKIQLLRAIESNIKSTMAIVHAKAQVLGLTHGAQVMTLDNGDVINLSHGYPIPQDLDKVLDVSEQM